MIAWDELDQHPRKQCSLAVPFTLDESHGSNPRLGESVAFLQSQANSSGFQLIEGPRPAAKRFEQRGTGQPRQHRPQRPFRRPRRRRRPRQTCERLTA